MPVIIVGSFISPYVRKVLGCLHQKGITFEIDPIVPFFGNDAFSKLSPLRRIPVLIDGDVTIADSTIICEYLEEAYPTPPLFPATPAARARARWLEEFADTRIGDVIIWQLFNQRVIGPAVWGRPTDEEIVRQTLDHDLPAVLDYLESEVPAAAFLFGPLQVADLAIATFFRNAAFARYTIDASRWPRTAGFVARVLGHPCMASLRRFEEISLTRPPPAHRDLLRDAGAPITATTFGSAAPRPGILPR